MRRRLIALATGAALALGVAAPVAAQGGPDREWLEEEVILFGEEYCGFEVLLEDHFAKVKVLSFPQDAAGNQRFIVAGVFKSTLTNLETGASIDITLGGSITYDEAADGTAVGVGRGTVLFWYSDEEAAGSQLGQGLFYGRGTGTEWYDASGMVERATFTGRSTDLCAELSR
jgi:hypothetical protein